MSIISKKIKLPEQYAVIDGNQANHCLFINTDRYQIRPDIIIEKGHQVICVADAKYIKAKPTKDDIAQVLSYMCAYGLDKCIIVCIKNEVNQTVEILKAPNAQVVIYPVG